MVRKVGDQVVLRELLRSAAEQALRLEEWKAATAIDRALESLHTAERRRTAMEPHRPHPAPGRPTIRGDDG